MMGNGRLHKIERFHTLGTPESERLNVTALNLFHPTASPPFQKVGVFHITTQSLWQREVACLREAASAKAGEGF